MMKDVLASLALLLPLVACGDHSDDATYTSTGAGGSSSAATTSTGAGGVNDPCTGEDHDAARQAAIAPVDAVSKGEVGVLAKDGAITTIFVDASAGGPTGVADNPWIYLSLASLTRVDVSDVGSLASTAWDLALERALVRTNGGDGGPGAGGAIVADEALEELTRADADAASFATEDWLDASCALATDASGSVVTTFADWYDYDEATHHLTPKPVTYLLRGGDGAFYGVRIVDYYATPDGGSGMAGGKYRLEIARLE